MYRLCLLWSQENPCFCLLLKIGEHFLIEDLVSVFILQIKHETKARVLRKKA